MPITPDNLKLVATEVMADTPDGGGLPTSVMITDGDDGNVFPKISNLDAVYGRVNLRKVAFTVDTADDAVLAGSYALVMKPPANPGVGVTMFYTGSDFDQRTQARDRVESYVTDGPESQLTLIGRQLIGQKQIVCYQKDTDKLPEIGQVLCLSTEANGVVTAKQFIRVDAVTVEEREFTEHIGSSQITFKRNVVTITMATPLLRDFTGPENPSTLSAVSKLTRVRRTSIVDAARYYGIAKLKNFAAKNAISAVVEGIFTQLVPTTSREVALVDVSPAKAGSLTSTSTNAMYMYLGAWWSANDGKFVKFPFGVTPGSLAFEGNPPDDAEGKVTTAGGGLVFSIDYTDGILRCISGEGWSGLVTFKPAVAVRGVAHTQEIKVTQGNRGTTFVAMLAPLPSKGSLTVEYQVLGKWYTLRDNGVRLVGDSAAVGTGSVNRLTGTVTINLQSQPDVDSSIIISYASDVHYDTLSQSSGSDYPYSDFDLGEAFDPTSLSMTFWQHNVFNPDGSYAYGYARTVGLNANNRFDNAYCFGYASPLTGKIRVYWKTLPSAANPVTFEYKALADSAETVATAVKSKSITAAANMSLGESVVPGSLQGRVPFGSGTNGTVKDVSGLLVLLGGQTLSTGVTVHDDTNIGTIDYATGDIVINQSAAVNVKYWTPPRYVNSLGRTESTPNRFAPWDRVSQVADTGVWKDETGTVSLGSGTAIFGYTTSIAYATAAATTTKSFSSPNFGVTFQATAKVGGVLVPNTLRGVSANIEFVDIGGTLFRGTSINAYGMTGFITACGSVNYTTGEATLTYWGDIFNGQTSKPVVLNGLSAKGDFSTTELTFRTSGNPLRPGSLNVSFTHPVHGRVVAISDSNGTIAANGVRGSVNKSSGLVSLEFGSWVTAAGNEGASWYDAANVVGANVWKPEGVVPGSLTYSGVVQTALPINADLLGLDPVRLPTNGKVPIFQPADVVLVHNTKRTAIISPAAGVTTTTPRVNANDMWVEDANGRVLPYTMYTADLENGSLTLTNAFSATGYTAPFYAANSVHTLAVVSDVQISGELTFTVPLTADFDTDSYVSTCLVFGDVNARVTNVRDVYNFTSWDATGQAQADGQYNKVNYPIVVTNNGAITERWRVLFTSSTTFNVYGENVGMVAQGDTSHDCAPLNSLTGQPYFKLDARGWSGGWSSGNNLMFNTVGTPKPIWLARTILPGTALTADSFRLRLRGDTDA